MDNLSDRAYWEDLLRGRSWEEIHAALEVGWKKGRGGKIISLGPCYECQVENSVICRPDGTFICRECHYYCGDKVQFVLDCGEILFPIDDVPDDDEVMEFVCAKLPLREDPRQLKLFYHKMFWRKPVPFHSRETVYSI